MEIEMENNHSIVEIADDNDRLDDNSARNSDHAVCRICYDEDNDEVTISPCHCVGSHGKVHVSCLENWLSVSKSNKCDVCNYSFKTVRRTLTLLECLREKNSRRDLFQQLTVTCTILLLWAVIVTSCAIKTFEYFSNKNDAESLSNGFLMTVITIVMAAMLWCWLILFTMYGFQDAIATENSMKEMWQRHVAGTPFVAVSWRHVHGLKTAVVSL